MLEQEEREKQEPDLNIKELEKQYHDPDKGKPYSKEGNVHISPIWPERRTDRLGIKVEET